MTNNLKNLWAEATFKEQIKLLLIVMEGVYIDAKQTKSIMEIRPKTPFKPIFQVVGTNKGSALSSSESIHSSKNAEPIG